MAAKWKSAARGNLPGLIEYRDAEGHGLAEPRRHRSAGAMHSVTHNQYLDLSFYAFVLPGDYTAAIAIVDPETLRAQRRASQIPRRSPET